MRKYGVTVGMIVAAFTLGLFVDHLPTASAQTSDRVVEIRTYTTAEGKLETLATRMETERHFFEKHGMTSVLYSVATDPPLSENTFIYILSHESREAAEKSWAAVTGDPEFQALIDSTGRTAINAEMMFVKPMDYSPVK